MQVILTTLLSQKYFQDYELTDEGNYWETGDESILEKNFKTYNDLVDGVAHSIKNYSIQSKYLFVVKQVSTKNE